MKDRSRRESLITVAVLAGLAGVFLFFEFLPGQKQAAALRQELTQAEQSVRDVPQRVAELEGLRGEVDKRKRYLAESSEFVPAEFDVHAIVGEVARLAERSPVKIARIEPLPEVKHRTYRTLSFRLAFRGTPHGIATFLRGWRISAD